MKKEMKKQLIIGVLIVLLLISVVVLLNRKKSVQTLNPVQFEEITGKKAENNIGEVPIIEKKVEVEKEKNTEKTEKIPSKTTKKTETKKKTTKNTKKVPSTTKPVAYNVGDLQSYAHSLVISYGWSEYDFECLVKLWNRESGWNPNAVNKKSGACGIPQSLPCNKMASHGSDYRTNGRTQIRWGIDYIKNRYGSPSGAWEHSQQKGWY